MLALNMELISRFLPGCMTVSEMFTYSSLNSFYGYFFFTSTLHFQDFKFIPGDNAANVYVIAPWIVLDIWGIAHLLLNYIESKMPRGFFIKPIAKLIIGFVIAFYVTLKLASPYNEVMGVYTYFH